MTKWFQALLFSSIFATSALAFAQTNELSKPLTASLSVSGQMSSEKFIQLMQQGYRSVIVNRPDEEQGNLVSVNQLREIGAPKGVAVIYQPVVSGRITPKDVEDFAKYYNQLAKPILMVCRSGSRSTQLFNQAKALGLIDE